MTYIIEFQTIYANFQLYLLSTPRRMIRKIHRQFSPYATSHTICIWRRARMVCVYIWNATIQRKCCRWNSIYMIIAGIKWPSGEWVREMACASEWKRLTLMLLPVLLCCRCGCWQCCQCCCFCFPATSWLDWQSVCACFECCSVLSMLSACESERGARVRGEVSMFVCGLMAIAIVDTFILFAFSIY